MPEKIPRYISRCKVVNIAEEIYTRVHASSNIENSNFNSNKSVNFVQAFSTANLSSISQGKLLWFSNKLFDIWNHLPDDNFNIFFWTKIVTNISLDQAWANPEKLFENPLNTSN